VDNVTGLIWEVKINTDGEDSKIVQVLINILIITDCARDAF